MFFRCIFAIKLFSVEFFRQFYYPHFFKIHISHFAEQKNLEFTQKISISTKKQSGLFLISKVI